MGDFMGHVLPGTLLLAVGLWRVWASVARFAADPPTAFRVRAWNPVPAVPARLLELHVVAGGAFLDMCVELYYASPLRALTGVGVDGVDHAAAHLGGLEHAGMLLMFFLFGALALVSEKTRSVRPSNAECPPPWIVASLSSKLVPQHSSRLPLSAGTCLCRTAR
jgi:hypothetical protein